ncbi:hypothetical protein QOT17_001465 [Balamuthia mandrillaris]
MAALLLPRAALSLMVLVLALLPLSAQGQWQLPPCTEADCPSVLVAQLLPFDAMPDPPETGGGYFPEPTLLNRNAQDAEARLSIADNTWLADDLRVPPLHSWNITDILVPARPDNKKYAFKGTNVVFAFFHDTTEVQYGEMQHIPEPVPFLAFPCNMVMAGATNAESVLAPTNLNVSIPDRRHEWWVWRCHLEEPLILENPDPENVRTVWMAYTHPETPAGVSEHAFLVRATWQSSPPEDNDPLDPPVAGLPAAYSRALWTWGILSDLFEAIGYDGAREEYGEMFWSMQFGKSIYGPVNGATCYAQDVETVFMILGHEEELLPPSDGEQSSSSDVPLIPVTYINFCFNGASSTFSDSESNLSLFQDEVSSCLSLSEGDVHRSYVYDVPDEEDVVCEGADFVVQIAVLQEADLPSDIPAALEVETCNYATVVEGVEVVRIETTEGTVPGSGSGSDGSGDGSNDGDGDGGQKNSAGGMSSILVDVLLSAL